MHYFHTLISFTAAGQGSRTTEMKAETAQLTALKQQTPKADEQDVDVRKMGDCFIFSYCIVYSTARQVRVCGMSMYNKS